MTGPGGRGGTGFWSADPTVTENRLAAMRWGTTVHSLGGEFEMGVATVEVSGLGFMEFWVVDDFRTSAGPIGDRHSVTEVYDGHLRWQSRAFGDLLLGPGDVAIHPHAEVEHTGVDLENQCVSLDARLLAEYAEHVHGVPAERFRVTDLHPRSPAHTRNWSATTAHVRDHVLGNPMLLGDDPARGETAFRMLAARFLATFPNTVLTERTRRGHGTPLAAPARMVREVVDYLRARSSSPVTPLDLVRLTDRPAADVVSGLRKAGTDPAGVLWRNRLELARADLLECGRGAGHDTVRRIAARRGFGHPGRFRVSYARAFGESPEDTAGR